MRAPGYRKSARSGSGDGLREQFKGFVALVAVGIVALSPLHLAGNRPDSWNLIALASAFLLVLVSLARFDGWRMPGAEMPADIKLAMLVVLLVAFWMMIQASTWTPAAWHHPYWSQASLVLGLELEGRISITPELSQQATMRLLTYLALFVAVLYLARRAHRARLGLLLLALICALYALYGIYRYVFGIETILWFEELPMQGVLTSTFINRNSFADYAAMGLLVCNGLLLNALRPRNRPRPSVLAALAGSERRATVLFGLVACVGLILLVSLVLTASRGAFVVFTATALIQILCSLIWGGLSRRMAVPMLAFAGVALVTVVLVWGQTLQERLLHAWQAPTYEKSDFDRIRVMAIGLDVAMQRPILGNGMGSFVYVFAAARDDRLASEKRFVKQHNTYLENLIELGFIASIALFSVFLVPVWRFGRGMLRRRSNHVFSSVGLMACIYVGIRSSFDYTLQVPANTILFVVILGLCLAQALETIGRSERNGSTSRTGGGSRPRSEES